MVLHAHIEGHLIKQFRKKIWYYHINSFSSLLFLHVENDKSEI